MRQGFKHASTKAVSIGILVCVVLVCGAMYGMAAQTALLHLGLDFGSVRDDLIVGAAARSRSALAWWAWWLFPLGAFFIGPLSVAVTRWIVANWWLFRAARLMTSAALILALAAIGGLSAAPSTLEVRSRAAASLAVVLSSALLAMLGARVLGGLGRKAARASAFAVAARRRRLPVRPSEAVRFRVAPIPVAPPAQGGGSAAAGAPFVRIRQRHALVARFTLARLALVALLAIVVCTAVVGLSGVTVLVEHATPHAVGRLVVWSGLRASEPPYAGEAAGMAAMTAPVTVGQAEPSGMLIDGVLIPESELTFAKGYLKRQAAVIAAQRASIKIVKAAEKAVAKLPARLKRVAALHPVRYGRTHRVARGRHVEKRDEWRIEQNDRARRDYTGDRRSTSRHPVRAREPRRARGHDRYALERRYNVARF